MPRKTSGAATAKTTAAKQPDAGQATAKEPEAEQATADQSTSGETEAVSALTKTDVAGLVMRPVQRFGKDRKPVLDEDKRPVFDLVPVEPEEVFDFAVRGDEVTVVTMDGRKLKGHAA